MSLKQSSKEPASSGDVTLARVPACWGRERDRDCLRVDSHDGEVLLLPYQHFVGAHLQRQEEHEVLGIMFSSHQLTLKGQHLEEIVLALQEFAVEWIACTPARYKGLAEGDSATISRLEIQAAE